MKLFYSFLLILIVLSTAGLSTAQTGNLQGTVTGENGEPIPGVNILVTDHSIGGATDADGNYRIEKIPEGDVRVRYSAVGYQTVFFNIAIEKNKTLLYNVILEEDVIEVGEVEVVDKSIQKQSDTRTSLLDVQPAKARVLPGAVTDVLRTLQALPGVLSPNDFSSQLIVRGSGPDQNLIIMDDVEIFNPYRLYGVISMFNPEAVSDINLVTGGFPAKYGDRLSAVLDVTNKQGTLEENIKGNLNASIVAANIVLEGKNPFNVPGSWIVNSRRTYYDLIIEPLAKNAGLVEENVAFPNFYDIQGKFTFGPFTGHKFFLNGILSRDGVDLVSGADREQPDSVSIFNETNNDLASFAWHYAPTERILNKVIVSWYRNEGDIDFDSDFLDPSLNREDFQDVDTDTVAPYLLDFSFNSVFSFEKIAIDDKFVYLWGEGNELEAGIGMDFMKTAINFEFELDPQLEVFIAANPNIRSAFDDIVSKLEYKRYRGYIHNRFKVAERLYLQPGFRYDFYNVLDKGYFAPRMSLSYGFDNLTTLRLAWGKYYQSPGYEKMRDQNVLYDLSREKTDPLEAEFATHYVIGLQRWITAEWQARVEAYYKDFEDLINPFVAQGTAYYTEQIPGRDPRYTSGWTSPVAVTADSVTQVPFNNSYGEAYGFEFYLEKKNIAGSNKFDGWISYSLAWAQRYEQGYEIPFRFDRRHSLNIVLNYELDSWLDFGMRFQYGTGFPYNEPVGVTPRIIMEDTNGDLEPDSPVIATRNGNEVVYEVDFGGDENRYQGRLPDYHRLDIRFTAYADYWDLDWAFYIDIINIYNRVNVINYDYYVTKELTLGREVNQMFPILPTFGFNVRF